MSDSILFSSGWTDKLNQEAQKISPELLLFLDNAPDYFNLSSPEAKFLQGVQSLYAIYNDTGWITSKLGYIYTGETSLKRQLYIPVLNTRVNIQALDDIIKTIRNLRAIIGHTAAAAHVSQTILCENWFQNVLQPPNTKPSKAEHYGKLVEELEKMAHIIEQQCSNFLLEVQKLSGSAREDARNRWREVILKQYSSKQDIILRSVIEFVYFESGSHTPITRSDAEHILLEYYRYDLAQLKNHLAYSQIPAFQAMVDDECKNRKDDIVGALPQNLQNEAEQYIDGCTNRLSPELYHTLLREFFSYDLPILISDTLKAHPECTLHPADLCMFFLKETTTDLALPNSRVLRVKRFQY